jgi:hypothetical protein
LSSRVSFEPRKPHIPCQSLPGKKPDFLGAEAIGYGFDFSQVRKSEARNPKGGKMIAGDPDKSQRLHAVSSG